MLNHHHSKPANPDRVVVLGAGGFVGSAAIAAFEAQNTPVVAVTRKECDLLSANAAMELVAILRPSDTLVVISAEAPVKNAGMLERNIRMMEAICAAIAKTQPSHAIYVSSDAVYIDSSDPLTENSCAEPGSLHGVMHLARELMLREAVNGPLAILRPTLIYGNDDPHNGYGPNRFRRLAATGEEIVLFGEGEEQRDHVYIDDVAELINRIALHRSEGILNAATGVVTTFRDIAEMVVDQFETPVTITGSPRQGPMPHGGYRAFDEAATRAAFTDFEYTTISDGIAAAHRGSAKQ